LKPHNYQFGAFLDFNQSFQKELGIYQLDLMEVKISIHWKPLEAIMH
jgi:hypothetical protein